MIIKNPEYIKTAKEKRKTLTNKWKLKPYFQSERNNAKKNNHQLFLLL